MRASAKALAPAEAALRAHEPTHFELLNPQASAVDLQAVLSDGEAYLRIVTGSHGGYGALVDKNGLRPFRIALTDEQAGTLADRIRRTTRIQGRALPDYDLDASMALYQGLLAPIADRLAQVRDLDVDTSGALASIPFAALVERQPDKAQLSSIHESQDYTGVAWLARRMSLSNALGPAALIRLRKAAPPSSAPHAVLYGDYAPDPHMAAARLALAKGLSSRCQAEVEHALTLLGPLPETADEVRNIAADFPAARLVFGAQFTDTDFLSNPDTANADFIMIATPGVLGVSSCFPEPALLTSLGAKGDGLIGASQLLDRDLKVQLVVLSACDTAARGRLDEASGGLGDGGDALSGFARAFIYTGVRNVLVTQWKVDVAASSAEMAAFVGSANRPGVNLGQALAMARRTLFHQAEAGHPFYWAAFIVLVDGERRLTSSSEASGKTGA